MEPESSSFWSDIKKHEETLAKDPQSYCFAPLSELYRKVGLLDDAMNVAKMGCEIHPNYVGGFMALGRAYYEKGMKAESRAALESVVRSTPDNLLAQKILSQLYIEAGEPVAAETALRMIISLNPGDLESQVLLESLKRGSNSQGMLSERKSDEEEFLLEELEVVDDLAFDAEADEASLSVDITSLPDRSVEVPAAEEFEDFLVFEDAEPVTKTDMLQAAGVGTDGKGSLPAAEEAWQFDEETAARETAEPEGKDPLTTVTLAELYVSQGFLKRALTIYRELLTADPDNEDLRKRLLDLKLTIDKDESSARDHALEDGGTVPDSSAQAERISLEDDDEDMVGPDSVAAGDAVLMTLQSWLDNISRRRQ